MRAMYLEYRSKYYSIAKGKYAVSPVTHIYIWRYVLGVFQFYYQFVFAQNMSPSCSLRKGRTTGGYTRKAVSNHHVNWYTFRNQPPQRKKINVCL